MATKTKTKTSATKTRETPPVLVSYPAAPEVRMAREDFFVLLGCAVLAGVALGLVSRL